MQFGFHVSISRGLPAAVDEARARGCQAIQIFSRNPRGWSSGAIDLQQAAQFRAAVKSAGISPVVIHMPYLANLAAQDKALFDRSVASVALELGRAKLLGAQFVVIHMGKAGKAPEDEALTRMVKGIDRAFARAGADAVKPGTPILLLENTAGMGSELGYRFEHLKAVIERTRIPNKMGVALDTAHLFEAGYEIRTLTGLNSTLRDFDRIVGLKRLHVIHLNDSKTDLGSRVDRHWHIGKGKVGREALRHIVSHPLLRHLPGIMETPRTGMEDDRMNMRTARALAD